MKDKYINLLLIFLESCNYRAKYYIRRYNFQGNQFVLPPKSHFLHKNEVVATLVELFAIVPSILYFEVVFQFLFDLPYFLQVSNVILSADLAVIFFKYQASFSSNSRSSNGLLILLLKVSAMWTYLSVVLMLLCPISSFTILMSVPCSSKWVANEWRSRCG